MSAPVFPAPETKEDVSSLEPGALKDIWDSYEKVAPCLRVQLGPPAGAAVEDQPWVSRPGWAGLPSWQLVYDLPTGAQKVHHDQAGHWGRPQDEIFDRALANTLADLRMEAGQMRVGQTCIRVLESAQDTGSTAVHDPGLMSLLPPEDRWLIAIPNSRTILAIPSRSSGQDVESLAFAAHCLFQASLHPVSPAQFAWNPDTGLQPLSARVARRVARKGRRWPYWLAGTIGVLALLQVLAHDLLVDSARKSSRAKDSHSSRAAADRALAISLTPTQEARARHWRAVSLYDEKHEDEALAEELHTLTLNPEASDPQALLSILYLRRNDLDRALRHAQLAIEKKDKYAEVHWVLSMIALKKGHIAASRLHMQRAIILAPGEPYYVNALKKLPLPPIHGN